MLYASAVFPKLERELQQRPELLQSIPKCLLEVRILKNGQLEGTWFILLMGRHHLAKINMHQPPRFTFAVTDLTRKHQVKVNIEELKQLKVELEDGDMLN